MDRMVVEQVTKGTNWVHVYEYINARLCSCFDEGFIYIELVASSKGNKGRVGERKCGGACIG